MQALEIVHNWYKDIVEARLQSEFAAEHPRIAAGLSGRGSECFGFDDEYSRDHDYELGLALYLTRQDEREFGFRLEINSSQEYSENTLKSGSRGW